MNTFKEKFDNYENKLKDLKSKSIKARADLQIAYDYKDGLYSKMKMADENITKKQNDFYQLLNEVTSEITLLKAEFDKEIDLLKTV